VSRVFTVLTTEDTKINKGAPTTNYSTSPVLAHGDYDHVNNIQNTIIRFDLSALPTVADVLSVKFDSWMDAAGLAYGTTAGSHSFYALLSTWTLSQVTWNVKSTGVNWATPGAYDPGTSVQATPMGGFIHSTAWSSYHQITVDLNSTVVKNWVSGNLVNNGILIKGDGLASRTQLELISSDDVAHASFCPQLTVAYRLASISSGEMVSRVGCQSGLSMNRKGQRMYAIGL